MPENNAPVVFYSWQSDLPNKTNRGLIEDALRKACKELSAEYEEAIRVDSGIDGEAGSPDIAATILNKIDAATVVVADVSIIGIAPVTGSNPPARRPLPNGNVMFELGYASAFDLPIIALVPPEYPLPFPSTSMPYLRTQIDNREAIEFGLDRILLEKYKRRPPRKTPRRNPVAGGSVPPP